MFIQIEALNENSHAHLQSLAESHNFVVYHAPRTAASQSKLPAFSLFWSRGDHHMMSIEGSDVQLYANHFVVVNPGQSVEFNARSADQPGLYQASICEELVRNALLELRASSRLMTKLNGSSWPVNFSQHSRACDGHYCPVLRDVERAASLRIQDGAWLGVQMRLLFELLLFEEFASRSREKSTTGAASPSLGGKLKKARQYLDTNYDKPIEIRSLAREMAVSQHHFIREFRRFYGDTPYQYLINKRLEAAMRLITDEGLPVGRICERVGFSSSDGFYKAFRRRYKASPSQFRKGGSIALGRGTS